MLTANSILRNSGEMGGIGGMKFDFFYMAGTKHRSHRSDLNQRVFGLKMEFWGMAVHGTLGLKMSFLGKMAVERDFWVENVFFGCPK